MMALLSSLSAWLGVKSFAERLGWLSLGFYALKHKEDVAMKCGHGEFEIVATGRKPPRKLP
jgi:hypothetical protein